MHRQMRVAANTNRAEEGLIYASDLARIKQSVASSQRMTEGDLIMQISRLRPEDRKPEVVQE